MNFNFNNGGRQFSVTTKSKLEIQLHKSIAIRKELRNRTNDPLVGSLLKLEQIQELRTFSSLDVNKSNLDDYKARLDKLV